MTSPLPVDNAVSLDCALKGQQKQFFLHLNSASSCCKSYSVSLTDFTSIRQLTDHWTHEKQQLALGNKIQSCQYCWHNESQGLVSYRQLNLSVTDDIELAFDNLCNQMCSYCSPKFSSQWQKSLLEHGLFANISASASRNLQTSLSDPLMSWLDQIEQYIASRPDKTVSIKLLGGEPLMQRRSLQKLVEFGKHKVKQLIVVTNLNPPSNRFLKWLLDHMPRDIIKFEISIDATPEFNHVPRAMFDQHRFLQNLELLQKHSVRYHLLSVVSALSLFDLANFVSWCNANSHGYSLLPLNNPDCLDPKLVPHQFRKLVQCDTLPKHVCDIVNYTGPTVDVKLFEQYNYLNQYFTRTKIDPTQTSNSAWAMYWQWLKERYQ